MVLHFVGEYVAAFLSKTELFIRIVRFFFINHWLLIIMNNEILREIITTPMPYGKYKGTMIADLPLYYLEWFASQGFPKGKLGMLLATTFEIKTNGLQEIIDTLKKL